MSLITALEVKKIQYYVFAYEHTDFMMEMRQKLVIQQLDVKHTSTEDKELHKIQLQTKIKNVKLPKLPTM